jgi:hypothetical protein
MRLTAITLKSLALVLAASVPADAQTGAKIKATWTASTTTRPWSLVPDCGRCNHLAA